MVGAAWDWSHITAKLRGPGALRDGHGLRCESISPRAGLPLETRENQPRYAGSFPASQGMACRPLASGGLPTGGHSTLGMLSCCRTLRTQETADLRAQFAPEFTTLGESAPARPKAHLRTSGSRGGRGSAAESRVPSWSLAGWSGMAGEGGEAPRRLS